MPRRKISRERERVQNCCDEVIPSNSARNFGKPDSIVEYSFDNNIIQSKSRILEVGSGCLRNSLFLSNQGINSIHTCELRKTVQKFRRKYSRFIDLGNTVFNSWNQINHHYYDILIVTFVLETICEPKDRLKLLKQIKNVLKLQGKVLVAVRSRKDIRLGLVSPKRCGDGFITRGKSFIRPFNINEIKELFQSSGYSNFIFPFGVSDNQRIFRFITSSLV